MLRLHAHSVFMLAESALLPVAKTRHHIDGLLLKGVAHVTCFLARLPKRYCSDTQESQPPLFILPHAFLSRLAGTQPLATRPITQVN